MISPHTRLAPPSSQHAQVLSELISQGGLEPVFQPILHLGSGQLHAHEALIRTPPGCVLPNPDALFACAREAGRSMELELECVRQSLSRWFRQPGPGALFVNLSATTLVEALSRQELALAMPVGKGMQGSLVFELTEHERVTDVEALATAVARLRRLGATLALDDFGDGRSSLRLWSELKPEYVKIDKYFTHCIHEHPEKVQTLRALRHLAETFGSTLVAEGIETAAELHLIRDLGIPLGQGWLIGRPERLPVTEPLPEAKAVVRSRDIAVIPERRRQNQQRATARQLLIEASGLPTTATNQQVFEHFSADESIESVAIIDHQRPVGLISRQRFMGRYVKPYFREVYGRQPCLSFANLSPTIVELRAGIDELTEVLTSADQRYLAEGFIIVEAGRYRGLGRGDDIVRAVTESRIEAARHANPLTLLPGNIPLTQHIGRLLESGRDFVACYSDLNYFKPFNDLYGYWRGDEMILLAARCLSQFADPRRDFVGHVGGDDFVVLLQSADWEERCRAILARFNEQALTLYDDLARTQGGVLAEDRFGTPRFHPLTTMCIGAVIVPPGLRESGAEDIADAAAQAKRHAKREGQGLYVQSVTDSRMNPSKRTES